MKGGKVTSHGELARTAVVDEHGEGQRTEPRGPVPGNAEATPALHLDNDGSLVATPGPARTAGLYASSLKVRLTYLSRLVASEALMCNKPLSGL